MCRRSAVGGFSEVVVPPATSRSPLASTIGAMVNTPAKARTAPSAISGGSSGVRRMLTMRREMTIFLAASAAVSATLGINVRSSRVIACGKTSGGIAT